MTVTPSRSFATVSHRVSSLASMPQRWCTVSGRFIAAVNSNLGCDCRIGALAFAPGKGEARGQFRIGEAGGEEVRNRTPANVSKESPRARQPLGFETDAIAEREECF